MTARSPIVSALLKLHIRLATDIKENRDQTKRLVSDMKAVETVIRMLEPGYDTRHMGHRRRLTPNPWFGKGEGYRSALDVLRKAERPLTAREIVMRMLAARRITGATKKQIRVLAAAVQTSCRNHLGKTTRRMGEGFPRRWALIKGEKEMPDGIHDSARVHP
jgi:hypothetical protein